MFGSQKRPCERTPWRLMLTIEHKRDCQVPAVVPSHRRYLSQNRKRFAKLSQNRKMFVTFSTCTDSGEGENPGKGLRCGVGRNGGGRKSYTHTYILSRRSQENPKTPRKRRLARRKTFKTCTHTHILAPTRPRKASTYVCKQARKWEKHDDETGGHQRSASWRAKPSAWCYKVYCKDTLVRLKMHRQLEGSE